MSTFHEKDANSPEVVRLAEENLRLSSENQRLHREQRQRATVHFLAELRQSGRLTPAMEYAGLEEALLTAEDTGLCVSFPDGRQVPLGEVLRAVLEALPVSLGRQPLAAAEEPGTGLSAEEKRIAAELGLSEDEYAGIKACS
jgi:hypothetical protein